MRFIGSWARARMRNPWLGMTRNQCPTRGLNSHPKDRLRWRSRNRSSITNYLKVKPMQSLTIINHLDNQQFIIRAAKYTRHHHQRRLLRRMFKWLKMLVCLNRNSRNSKHKLTAPSRIKTPITCPVIWIRTSTIMDNLVPVRLVGLTSEWPIISTLSILMQVKTSLSVDHKIPSQESHSIPWSIRPTTLITQ